MDKLIAQGLGFALQIRQHPIPILVFIRLLARVNVGRTLPQHTVDQPGRLCRKFCTGGREGAVAPVCGEIKRPGSRTVQPQ